MAWTSGEPVPVASAAQPISALRIVANGRVAVEPSDHALAVAIQR